MTTSIIIGHGQRDEDTGEPDDAKVACPVRRGAGRKGRKDLARSLPYNVGAKLAAADAAGPAYTRNAEALRLVQPEDVLPGDIDAHLGAPWIPETDMQAFTAALFGVLPDAVHIAHVKQDAVWSVEGSLDAVRSVAATTDYGTERANGVWLLEHALNLKTPVIYDTVVHDGKEERVLNQDATLAAREKQQRIKEQFKGWLFTDPDRTERLVRMYNDTYNTQN